MLNFIKPKFAIIKQFAVKLPKPHLYIISALFAVCLLLIIVPSLFEGFAKQEIGLPELFDPVPISDKEAEIEFAEHNLNLAEDLPDYEWVVTQGDTLGEVFSMFNLSYTMTKILEADKNVLSLDIINQGDTYRFWLSGDDDDFDGKGIVLNRMEQVLGIEHQVVFKRKGEGFEYKETILDGIWKQTRIVGEVKKGSNFYNSAVALGLPRNDVAVIGRLLKSKINFARSTIAGDKFQIVLSSQFVDGTFTGNTKIEGVRFFNRKRIYSAFSYKGNYFDSKGEGLERAFSRYPLKTAYRISSKFNPRRRHPITRLIRPHNGTDFAVRTGTPIYAPGDGVVKRVVRHKYAGLYIEVQHSYKYRTRYLHLSKALVRKGQRVKRGQKIALSGNTGASTGAHLHYEFHVNQKPINAMGSQVPIAIGVDRKSMAAYKKRVASLIRVMQSKSFSSKKVKKPNNG